MGRLTNTLRLMNHSYTFMLTIVNSPLTLARLSPFSNARLGPFLY
jgi:hypothetical protein